MASEEKFQKRIFDRLTEAVDRGDIQEWYFEGGYICVQTWGHAIRFDTILQVWAFLCGISARLAAEQRLTIEES